MTNHDSSYHKSQSLCDLLCEGLRASIPKLRCDPIAKWCALYEQGRTRFAYVLHLKTRGEIEIWCRGNPIDLSVHPGIHYTGRASPSGGWSEAFPGRFKVHSTGQIDAAVKALLLHSYKQSQPR